jgi:hypothetical protein
MLAHFAGYVGSHNVTVFEFNPKSRVWKGVYNNSFHLYGFFLCHLLDYVLYCLGGRIVQDARELSKQGVLALVIMRGSISDESRQGLCQYGTGSSHPESTRLCFKAFKLVQKGFSGDFLHAESFQMR